MGLRYPLLSGAVVPLIICFPFLLGYYLWRIAKDEPSYKKLSALWLGGIYTVIFGTLICMLFSASYIIFVEPGFVHHYVENALTQIETSPMASQYAASTSLMRDAMAAHILPSGMEFVTGMGWLTCFGGSILSLVLAALISRTGRRKRRQALW